MKNYFLHRSVNPKNNIILLLFSASSVLLAVAVTLVCGRSSPDKPLVILSITGLALILLWSKSWHVQKNHPGIIACLGLIGLFASLFFRDDFFGGEWLFHLRRGYPFSWIKGGISIWHAVDNGIEISEFVARNWGLIHWTIDLPALIVDAVFWLNTSIVMVLLPTRRSSEPKQ